VWVVCDDDEPHKGRIIKIPGRESYRVKQDEDGIDRNLSGDNIYSLGKSAQEIMALREGFPEGWIRHVGGDEDWYDMYIDRYSKQGVTIWKDRSDNWYWKSAEDSEVHQTMAKHEAIDAAERFINTR
jgi:hypothetical protein